MAAEECWMDEKLPVVCGDVIVGEGRLHHFLNHGTISKEAKSTGGRKH
jgi:hypothetical protein